MAEISLLSAIVDGFQRHIDLSSNTLVVQDLKLNGTLLSSTSTGNAGSLKIGDDNSYTNFTPTGPTVKGALAGIDAALSSVASALDGTFRIKNTSDQTKMIAFSAAGITAGQTRTITMPDFSVNLGSLTNANISASAAIDLTKLATLTAGRAVVSDGSGYLIASVTSALELSYVGGVTSNIQTQLNSLASNITALQLYADQWVKFTVSYADLADSSGSFDIELTECTMGQTISGIVVKHSEEFTGGSISDYTVSVGISGDFNKFANAFSVFNAPSDSDYQVTQVLDVPSFSGSTSIRIQAVSVGDDLDQATQGSVDIWLKLSTLP